MARGATLATLVSKLRKELGQTSDAGVTGVSKVDQYKQVLSRTQETLYDAHDWPFLNNRKQDKTISAGQYVYDLPSDINFEGVVECWHYWSNQWVPLEYGISMADYNARNSENDERENPVQKWMIRDTGAGPQVEIWPNPSSNGTLKFVGKAALGPLVADADTAELDDILIVLFAAAELRQGNEDANVKAQLASGRLATLKARYSKSGPIRIGGVSDARLVKPAGAIRPTIIRIAGA